MSRRLVCLLPLLLVAADWPQLLGPTCDGQSPETGLKREWPAGGLPKLWEVEAGAGYSGPVVVGEQVLLFHRVGDDEVLQCWSAAEGKPRWEYKAPTGYVDQFSFDEGPRATPVVAGGKVYTLGAEGRLTCVDLAKGQRVWERDLAKDYPFRQSYFGVGTSPLVDAKRVYVNIGSKGAGIVALDRDSGKDVWKATDDEGGYSSPTLAKLDGADRLVFLTRTGLVVLDPATGKVLHQRRFRARIDASVNAATPLVANDQIFLTASYNTGALLLDWNKGEPRDVWKNDRSLSCHYNTPVKVGDYLYGIHGRQEAGAELRCVEWPTGAVKWAKPGFGCAALIAADGLLVAVAESGEFVLLEPSPEAYREKGRFAALPRREPKPVVAPPALADGRLFARDGKRLAAWDLKK
ncbi:MAG: PQQ-binding-like beta-propeller repeat protein [Gemmataceae bacterium]